MPQPQNTLTHLQIPTPNQNALYNFKEKINIATHNIRGINNLTKFHLWIDFCLQEKLHIVSLTETKLKDNPNATTNPHYKIFTSNYHPTSTQSRETSLGTAILVHNTIQPYIHDINTLPGTAIYIDFFFPGNKTRIISIYLPSNNNEYHSGPWKLKRETGIFSFWETSTPTLIPTKRINYRSSLICFQTTSLVY